MNKKITFILIICLSFTGLTSRAVEFKDVGGNEEVDIIVDNSYLESRGLVIDSRTLVPLRDLLKSLNFKDQDIVWEKGKIRASSLDYRLEMEIDSSLAYVNGEEKKLDLGPRLIDGKTMVPLRFISESLGRTVNFKKNTVLVDSSPYRIKKNGDIHKDFYSVETDRYLFLDANKNLLRVEKSSIPKAKLEESIIYDDFLDCSELNTDGQHIYFIKSDTSIIVMDLEGEILARLEAEKGYRIKNIFIEGNYLYYSVRTEDRTILKMASLKELKPKIIGELDEKMEFIYKYGDKIYYLTERAEGNVYALRHLDLNSKNVTHVAYVNLGSEIFRYEKDKVIYSTNQSGAGKSIARIIVQSLDGRGDRVLNFLPDQEIINLDVEDGIIYYTVYDVKKDEYSGRIQTRNLAGDILEPLKPYTKRKLRDKKMDTTENFIYIGGDVDGKWKYRIMPLQKEIEE